ncbi:hypothetical protein PoB_005476500 [Plakobranchus ocellatus]|uniref:Uncharacterized protein n=1 Tax=Plakobranchus ocellatus TaxID=259542 RepID=A0AAV4CA41_9GAST|nr:hypothetical protein PoB_005476500 [Plakobranchus ocellatus]
MQASPHQRDPKLSGLLSGQGAGGGARTSTEGFLPMSRRIRYPLCRGCSLLVACESALRSAGTFQSRVELRHRRPGLTDGLKA